MRASTAMTPSGRAITGLRSSSATCGRSSARHDTRSRVSRRADVARRLAALPEQRGCRADRVDQVIGVGGGELGQAGHAIAQHLGGDPAEPEHHHRAEHRFLHDADDGLDAAGDHGLH
jgi:hypothetical protein